jgi:hypothetical protein
MKNKENVSAKVDLTQSGSQYSYDISIYGIMREGYEDVKKHCGNSEGNVWTECPKWVNLAEDYIKKGEMIQSIGNYCGKVISQYPVTNYEISFSGQTCGCGISLEHLNKFQKGIESILNE